jgi:heptosyltransferase-3
MSLGRSLRKGALGLSARGLGWLTRVLARRPGPPGPPSRILVIRVDERVGNVLLTTPLLRALRTALPNAAVHALVAASKARILSGLVDVVPFEKKDLWRHPLRFVRLLWRLRRGGYDAVLDASHWHHFSFTSALLMGVVGAPLRITHARGPAAAFATHAVAPPQTPEWEVATKLRLLAPLGVPVPAPTALETGLGQGDAAAAMERWLAERGVSPGRVVGLAPGARKPDHRAPIGLFTALGRLARDAGYEPVVLWGPGEEALAESVRAGCDGLVAPPTDLDQLAALMRACRVVVANDTGPMHLAVACGAQTLALFRGAEPIRWGHAALGHPVVAVPEGGLEAVEAEAAEALRRLL